MIITLCFFDTCIMCLILDSPISVVVELGHMGIAKSLHLVLFDFHLRKDIAR